MQLQVAACLKRESKGRAARFKTPPSGEMPQSWGVDMREGLEERRVLKSEGKKGLGKKSSFTGPAVLTLLSLADTAERWGQRQETSS